MLKIANRTIRSFFAGVMAIFSGLIFCIAPAFRTQAKGYIGEIERSRRPNCNSYLIRNKYIHDINYKNDDIRTRKPVTIKDMPVEKGVWTEGEYYIEEHDATTLHHDFTIIVNGKCYRMARSASPNVSKKKGYMSIFPGHKEKSGWIRQPEHYFWEVPNPEYINDGYGAGTTKVLKHGKCYVMVSDNNNMHVIFEDVDGVYVFVETKDNQVLMMRKHHEGHWLGKHKMIDAPNPDSYIENDDYALFIKKDGAAVEWEIYEASNGKKYLKVWSWRPNARIYKESGHVTQIEHTYRLKICDKPMPDDMPTAKGRGELWCRGPNGRLHVASVMNSNHYNARNSQHNPELYMHDVVEFEGEDVSHISYEEKIIIMEQIHAHDNRMKIPEYSTTKNGKKKLWEKAKKEDAVDGVIAWNYKEQNSKPTKIKFTHDKEGWHSATIVDFAPQEGEHSDKYVYPILENGDGVRFQASGKGLTNEVKADMKKNPDKYIGMEVRYAADSHFENSGKPFQPTIKELNAV
jgi:hypothetical protein